MCFPSHELAVTATDEQLDQVLGRSISAAIQHAEEFEADDLTRRAEDITIEMLLELNPDLANDTTITCDQLLQDGCELLGSGDVHAQVEKIKRNSRPTGRARTRRRKRARM